MREDIPSYGLSAGERDIVDVATLSMSLCIVVVVLYMYRVYFLQIAH